MTETMELTDWDRKVKHHLQMISAGVDVIKRHVFDCVGQPDFNTIAMADLDNLIINLTAVLRELEKQKQDFMNKPVVK